MNRCVALFVVAVAVTVVFALLTTCAAPFAASVSPLYAAVLVFLVGAMHIIDERNHR